MDGGLGSHIQRNPDDAARSNDQNDHFRTFNHAPPQLQSSDWSFAPAPQQTSQGLGMYNKNHRVPYQQPYQHLARQSTALNRLSLAPRNIYTQHQNEPQVLNNINNHFTLPQSTRESLPFNRSITQRHNTAHPGSTIDSLANAMLMQSSVSQRGSRQPMPPVQYLEQDSNNFFGSVSSANLSQLQPQKQQITPPFNLSGYVYSPETRPPTLSSSPLTGQASSPTARAYLRRTTNRMGSVDARSRDQTDDIFPGEDTPMSETPVHVASQPIGSQSHQMTPIPSIHTPQRQVIQPTRHIPSLSLQHAPPMAHGIPLISPHDLPDRFRHVFPYELFNAAQSKCFEPIFKTNENIVVSAPTGSGKTAILELAICKVVEGHQCGTFKIVYLAPIKSLCSERLRDWTKKFSHLNLPCAELTGDTNLNEMDKVRSACIIVTTPEKWDSITRKWADHVKLVQMVKLFLIDEVHILKDPRGSTLEAIVSRMKKMSSDVRFVALSATIPNSQDIASWLGKDHISQHLPAHRETFGEDFRPVRLQRHVHGFDGMMNDFAFERVLDGKLPGLIRKYTHNKPILVFCYTRKSCEKTAVLLAEWWSRQQSQERAWPAPKQRVNVSSKELMDLLDCGIAFHHAGLDVQDRHAIEVGFLGGKISVICCTSTLAVGVNLPCHLVILKGSVGYQDGKLCEYSDLEVMQMLGRAGRPQFDDSAIAIIMTRTDRVERYKKMISGQDTLESTLHLNFIEHLNTEVSLGTVKNAYEAKVWLDGTFLSVRMRQNPKHYEIDGVDAQGNTDQRLEQACERGIKLLQECNLVTDKAQFACTEYGEAMSKYMVKFETMKLLLTIPSKANTEQILNIVCQASEFKDLKMKPNERPVLREFNKSPIIKYQIKDTVATTAHKVFLMLQVQLGRVEHPNEKEFNVIRRQFVTETTVIFERVQRLMRCIIDCKLVNEDSIATRHALDLARSLSAGFWEYSNLQLRQIPQVGPVAIRKMVSSNINSIERLDQQDAASIERIMSKNPPFGKRMKDHLATFPHLEITSGIVGKASFQQGKNPQVNVKATLRYQGARTPSWNGRRPSLTFMAEVSGGRLVHFWRGNISKLDKGLELRFIVELLAAEEEIKCWIACDGIVGTVKTSTLMHDIPHSRFPPRTTAVESKYSRFSEENTKKITPDEFGDDELSDNELVTIVQNVEKHHIDYSSDGFADVDSLVDLVQRKGGEEVGKEKPNHPKMSNGKYTCQHPCCNGQLLKNGKMCKHKCCTEGLNKPPTRKRKLSNSNYQDEYLSQKDQIDSTSKTTTSNRLKKQMLVNRNSVGFKSDEQFEKDLENVECINLTEDDISPISYQNTSKQKAQLSYSSDSHHHDFPVFKDRKNSQVEFEFGDLSDEDFPTTTKPTDISRVPISVDKQQKDVIYSNRSALLTCGENPPGCTVGGMEGLIDHTSDSAEASTAQERFTEGLFDFDAFDDIAAAPEEDSIKSMDVTSPMRESFKAPETPDEANKSEKRATSLEADIEEVEHRRVLQAEQVQKNELDRVLPEWVHDMDPDLIDFLKGFVEFVD